MFLYAPIKQVAEVPRVVGANMTGEDEHPGVAATVSEEGDELIFMFVGLPLLFGNCQFHHVSDIERDNASNLMHFTRKGGF